MAALENPTDFCAIRHPWTEAADEQKRWAEADPRSVGSGSRWADLATRCRTAADPSGCVKAVVDLG